MGRAVEVEWSASALADIDRFGKLLAQHYPRISGIVAARLMRKAELLGEFPELGRAITNHPFSREAVLRVLNANYVFQYRYDGERIVMLRIFHSREDRSDQESAS